MQAKTPLIKTMNESRRKLQLFEPFFNKSSQLTFFMFENCVYLNFLQSKIIIPHDTEILTHKSPPPSRRNITKRSTVKSQPVNESTQKL